MYDNNLLSHIYK